MVKRVGSDYPCLATQISDMYLIFLQMLSLAHGRPEYRPLFDATHSIIFMATPHRGSDKATYADLAERMLKCGKLFTAEPTKAAQELQLFSAVLEDYNTNFVDISEKIRIISFYEKKPYGPVGLVSHNLRCCNVHELTFSRLCKNGLH